MSRRLGVRRGAALALLLTVTTVSSAPRVQAEALELRLVAQNVNVALDRQLRFVVAIDDPVAQQRLRGDRRAALRITLHRPVTDRAAVRAFASGASSPGTVVREDVPLVRLGSGPRGELVALVPVSGLGRGIAAGLYPVGLTLVSSDGYTARLRTFVNVFDPTVSPPRLPVSIVLGITAASLLQPDGTQLLPSATRDRLSRLLELLEADSAPYSVALPPELLDGLERLGETDLATRIEASARRHVVLPATYVPVDPLGGGAPRFAEQHARGLLSLSRLSPSSGGVWYSPRTLDVAGLSTLAALGYDRVVFAPDASAPRPSNYGRAYGVNGAGAVQVRFADPRWSDELGSRDGDYVVRVSTLVAEILAEHAEVVAASGDPTIRHVILAGPTGTTPDPAFLNPLGIALARAPQVALVGLRDSPVDDTGPTRLSLPTVDADSNPAREDVLELLATDVRTTASMLTDDSPLRDEWRRSWLTAGAVTLDDVQFEAYVRGLRSRLRAVRSAVRVPSTSTFTLGSRESDIRLQVRNESDVELSVVVELRSAKLQFPEEPGLLVVPPQSVSDLVVPVVARANGTFPLEVRLLTPDGNVSLGQPTVVTARVNALAGLGQLITGIAIVLLLSWWYSHWRSRRLAAADPTTLEQ